MLIEILAVCGIVFLAKIALDLAWSTVQGFRAHILPRIFPTSVSETYGPWAVVTGCTAGVGRAYAAQLAQRGVNLILVSRNIDKLNKIARTVERDYGVQTKVIQADFTESRPLYQRISKELNLLDIGVLVNNVGVVHNPPLYFSEISEEFMWDMINTNISSMTMMTRMILPSMLKKKRGIIINVASMAALKPTPLISMYGATKSYVDYLSKALSEECRGTGVKVQSLVPSYINTDLLHLPRSSNRYLVPSPERYAHNAITTLGVVNSSTGYWIHGVMLGMTSLCPTWAWLQISHWWNRRLRSNSREIFKPTFQQLQL